LKELLQRSMGNCTSLNNLLPGIWWIF